MCIVGLLGLFMQLWGKMLDLFEMLFDLLIVIMCFSFGIYLLVVFG